MPFTKEGNVYKSPSGKTLTKKQIRKYYSGKKSRKKGKKK